ncbi:MAG: MFS transporter [Eubacterium sp.]|nr:MFS transporter [Eubacterium sp.]
MFKGKFGRYAITFCILGVVYMFMYSGLQNDQINIIYQFSAWTNEVCVAPLTAANVVSIALSFVYGSLFIKFGPKKTVIPCILLSALGCVGIALANGLASSVEGLTAATQAADSTEVVGSYALYAASLFLIRCTIMCCQLAGFMFATNWFIRYRGRVLGIITLGSPLFTVVGTSVMSSFITKYLGGDYRPFYVGVAIILVLIALITAVMIADKPEDVGLYPDGEDHAPASEDEGAEEGQATLGEVLKNSKTWIMIINFGCFNFIINACMASMVVWFIHLAMTNQEIVAQTMAGPLQGILGDAYATAAGGDPVTALGMLPNVLFIACAVKWLSMGAILGIPMSFVFGVIDDKLGTPIACICLGVTEFLPIIGLIAQKNAVATTGTCNVPMLILWGFGVACMTGGVPTMNPASVGYAFGRREYATASRVVLTLQLIPMAFSAQIMAALINGSNDMMGWYLCIAIVIVGIIFCIPMFSWGDAMAADRK